MKCPVKVAAAAIAIVGIVSIANAAVVNEKCIASGDVVCPIGHYVTFCTGSLPQFLVNPGNAVTSIIINSSAVILDTHNQLGVGFEYAITADCNGVHGSDPHSIPSGVLDNLTDDGIHGPYPMVGLLAFTGDPMGSGSCTVTMQCQSVGSEVTVKGSERGTTGVNNSSSVHIQGEY